MGSISTLEAFTIGIGPSSSHTVGPMRAARRFVVELKEREFLEDVASLKVELYGSLAMTGKGHATDMAILLGLEGETPEGVDPDSVPHRISAIQNKKEIMLFGRHRIPFEFDTDLLFLKGKRLPFHSNAMRIKAFNDAGKEIHGQVYYSVGGGFVVDHKEAMQKPSAKVEKTVPFPFKTAEDLMRHAEREKKAIWEIVFENELAHHTEAHLKAGIHRIWHAMQSCVQRGIQTEGVLPGGLDVKRRAPDLYKALKDLKIGR